MSLVFAGVEVAGGPTVGLKDHVTIPVYLQQHGDSNNDNHNDHRGEEEKGKRKERNGFFIEEKVAEEKSSETSSIGVQSSDSSSEKEEEEVQSKAKNGAFRSLDSLEESLPIKRGLSNFFFGKSKSFASLADVATANARDLVKPDNPFNKRRRLLMASRTRRASYASFMTCLPPLSSDHIAEEIEKEEEEDEDERNSSGDSSTLAPLPPHVSRERKIKKAFRSPRSFSLSDLQNV